MNFIDWNKKDIDELIYEIKSQIPKHHSTNILKISNEHLRITSYDTVIFEIKPNGKITFQNTPFILGKTNNGKNIISKTTTKLQKSLEQLGF